MPLEILTPLIYPSGEDLYRNLIEYQPHHHPMTEYRYLVYTDAPGAAPRLPKDCVRVQYPTREALGRARIISEVRAANDRSYFVLPSLVEAEKFIAARPRQIFHEIIPDCASQRHKFDIDAKNEDLMSLPDFDSPHVDPEPLWNEPPATLEERKRAVMEVILRAIQSMFVVLYSLPPPRLQIFTTARPHKMSYHVFIADYFVESNQQARIFAAAVIRRLCEDDGLPGIARFIDSQVYNNNQSLRLMGQHKADDTAMKVYDPTWPEFAASEGRELLPVPTIADSFVTNINGCDALDNLPSGDIEAAREAYSPEYEEIRDICDACEDLRLHHTFRAKAHGKPFYAFDSRHTQTQCSICPQDGHRNMIHLYEPEYDEEGRLVRHRAARGGHTGDNFYFVFTRSRALEDGSGYTVDVYLKCRSAPRGTKGQHIGQKIVRAVTQEDRDRVRNMIEAEQIIGGDIAARVASAREGKIAQSIRETSGAAEHRSASLFDLLPNVTRYSEPAIRPFELAATLFVRAGMKMGKTKALTDYLRHHHNSTSAVIRVISFRRTFSANLMQQLETIGFQSYQSLMGAITADDRRVVIQVESLYRLEILDTDGAVDLVVLDECESILEQFDSPYQRANFETNFSNFRQLIGTARHVVCMDAYITDRTYNVMSRMRPITAERWTAMNVAEPETPVAAAAPGQVPRDLAHAADVMFMPGGVYHCNEYRNQTGDTYLFTADLVRWLRLIHSAVDAQENIVICSNSKSRARQIQRVLIEYLELDPTAIGLYDSETQPSVINRHLADVGAYWSQYRVLIYTPTITAGVSFEVEHYQRMFCYFTDRSCNVGTCTQMMGRVRNLSARESIIYVEAFDDSMPTDTRDIRRLLTESRRNLGRRLGANLRDWYNTGRELPVNGSPYFDLFIENLRINNISRNSFTRVLVRQLAEYGATLCHVDEDEMVARTGDEDPEIIFEKESEIREWYSDAKAAERIERAEDIAFAPDLEPAAIAELENRIAEDADLSPDERAAMARHRLRQTFHYPAAAPDGTEINPISTRFVEKYSARKVKTQYRNLCLVARTDVDRIETAITADHENQVPQRFRACAPQSYERMLRRLQKREQERFIRAMRDAPDTDARRDYCHEQHRFAMSILRALGIESVFDYVLLSRETIHREIRAIMPDIERDFPMARFTWDDVRVPAGALISLRVNAGNREKFVPDAVKFINGILRSMYGSSLKWIKPNTQHNGMYAYRPCTLFERRIVPADGVMLVESAKPIIWINPRCERWTEPAADDESGCRKCTRKIREWREWKEQPVHLRNPREWKW